MSATKNTAEKISATVAIIGSGVAGALTACRLAELGVKDIVIIEAGPRIQREDIVRNVMKSPYDLDFSSGYPNPPHAPRPDWSTGKSNPLEMTGPVDMKSEYLRVVGGTTWHWSGSTPRLHPADFSLRTHYGVGQDWPLDYKTLAPFYSTAESELGVAGDDGFDDGSPREEPFPMPPVPLSACDKTVAQALLTLGIKCFSRPVARATKPYQGRMPCMGYSSCMPICPSGAQYSGIYHVEKAEKMGVRLLENTRVDRIAAAENITHLEAARPDGGKVIVQAQIYVLAANGIESPRLLLMSAGERQPLGIANSSGMVGRNFMDHISLTCILRTRKPVWQGRGPVTIMATHDFRDGTFRRARPAWILMTDNRPHITGTTTALIGKGVEPPALDSAIRDVNGRTLKLGTSIEKLADPQNGIRLDWSKRDSAGQPVMKMYYSHGDYERRGIDHARQQFPAYAKALQAEIAAVYGPFTSNHQMGMTRMGDNPKSSVTDSFGRCHDHKNLFIASSALFPSIGSINPTLTIAALALRTAAEITRQLSP